MTKVEDDIAELSILVAEYQIVRNVELELRSASSKLLALHDNKHREDQNVASKAYALPGRLSGSRIVSQFVTDITTRLHQFDLMSLSCTCSNCMPDLTTVIVNYCTPKADNFKNLNHNNIPKHVSNNCLVLTYK
jgi:hypothetical protein